MSEKVSHFFGCVLHLVRASVEAATPLSIGDADNAAETDHAIVRDANGLPALPGASIGGAYCITSIARSIETMPRTNCSALSATTRTRDRRRG